MSGKEVIRAAQMFTKNGVASKTSVVKELVIGTGLGLALGLWWQVSCIIIAYSVPAVPYLRFETPFGCQVALAIFSSLSFNFSPAAAEISLG